MSTRRFELVSATSSKFWEISQDGEEYAVCFGRIGTKGQTKTKALDSEDSAKAEVAKLVREKTGKGYVEVGMDEQSESPQGQPSEVGSEGKPASKPKRASASKSLSKTKESVTESNHLTDEQFAKISKLVETDGVDNLKLAFHLLETLEANDQEWSKIFNTAVLTRYIWTSYSIAENDEPQALDLWKLVAGAFQNKEVLNFRFVDLAIEQLELLDSDDLMWFVEKLFNNFPHELSNVAKRLLYKCPDAISDLTSLSDAAAESLSKHQGDLNLRGLLGSLSDAAAESFSKHQGDLDLDGLESLSDAAAESLSKHQGSLRLDGLESLSDAAAESLSKRQGDLNLRGLKSLSDAAAESFSKRQGDLDLPGLEKLSNAAAESLGKHQGDLDLGGLESLSDAAAESLSKHQGGLHLRGLTSLSDAAAESLSKHQERYCQMLCSEKLNQATSC